MTSASWRHGPRVIAVGALAIALANGIFEITFGARVPDVRASLGLGISDIGLVASAFPVGLLGGSLTYTAISRRWGTAIPLAAGAVLCFAPLIAVAWLLGHPGPGSPLLHLAILWAVSGFGGGMLDPATTFVTTHAHPNPLFIQLVQAIKMGGTVLSATAGLAAIAVDFGVAAHFVLVGALALVLGLGGASVLPNVRNRPDAELLGPDVGYAGLARLTVVMVASIIPLGAAIAWATTILDELRAPQALEGLGLVGFTASQAVGMLMSYKLAKHVRPQRMATAGILTASAGVGAIGLVAAHVAHPFLGAATLAVVVAGFALLGLGSAPLPGLAMASAARVRTGSIRASTRIGVIVSIQYAAQGGAPAIIGLIGDVTGVTPAFALVALACLLALPIGHGVLRHAAPVTDERYASPVVAAVSWWAQQLRDHPGAPDPEVLDRWEHAVARRLQATYDRFHAIRMITWAARRGPLRQAAEEVGMTTVPLTRTQMRIRSDGKVRIRGAHEARWRRLRRRDG